MIGIIDLNCCNIASVQNMLNYLNIDNKVVIKREELKNVKKLILPGLGSFDYAIENFHALNMFNEVKHKVLNEKIPILGICLGMQLLAKKSEEGNLEGLGFFNVRVKKFIKKKENDLIPHMGWNTCHLKKKSQLFEDFSEESKYYFVHSYYITLNENTVTSTNYIEEFSSSISSNNIHGVQFHPEKSHKYGMRLLENFSKYA